MVNSPSRQEKTRWFFHGELYHGHVVKMVWGVLAFSQRGTVYHDWGNPWCKATAAWKSSKNWLSIIPICPFCGGRFLSWIIAKIMKNHRNMVEEIIHLQSLVKNLHVGPWQNMTETPLLGHLKSGAIWHCRAHLKQGWYNCHGVI